MAQQINPLLIHHLTGKPAEEIPQSPTLSWLKDTYAKLINNNINSIERIFEENNFMLTCKNCVRKGKYDVGLMAINSDHKRDKADGKKRIQTTGYFRCKHCNDAGNWEMPADFFMKSMTSMLMCMGSGSSELKSITSFGNIELYDGSWHLFSSDAETHLLNKLTNDPNPSYVWNRLGNLYHKGGRAELAATAFEKSVLVDHEQLESHYTLGDLFFQIDDFEKSSYHFKKMLLSASNYQRLPVEELRAILANGLQTLFIINQYSKETISFLPSKEELEAAGKLKEIEKNRVDIELEILPDEIESFYPFAEMYMGTLSKRIPKRLRTLKTPVPVKKNKKRHKRGKKK